MQFLHPCFKSCLFTQQDFCVGPGSALQGRGGGRGGQEARWHRTQCNTSAQLKGEKSGSCMVCLRCLHTSTQGRDSRFQSPHGLCNFPQGRRTVSQEQSWPCHVWSPAAARAWAPDGCGMPRRHQCQASGYPGSVVSLSHRISGKHTGTQQLSN